MAIESRFVAAAPSSTVDRRYVVKREIARGGMGIVFEAEHTMLRAPVALKTLTSEALDWPLVHARLMREARALSIVRHPGVAAVLDAGTCAAHGPYLALEMIEGRSLESFVVARQRLDVESVVHVASQLGATVSFVHDRGVVHRDLKPGNVLVCREPARQGDVLKLLDFGIAVVPGDEDVIDRKLTHSGEVLGTVEYMAPEQLLDGALPTKASDIYALGVLLYECLTGDVPFPGTPTQVMTTLLAGKPVPSIRQRRPDVPPALEAAILRALSRDPAARYPRADALAAAVAAAVPRLVRPLSLLDMPAEPDPSTRRQYARAPFVTPVRIVASNGPADGRTEDVSEGGLLVVTNALVKEGERVSVRLPLPGAGRVVVIEAIARWARTRRGQKAIGIAFTNLPDDARADIRTYVALMTGSVGSTAAREARAA
jgi:serine/threonine-protein kinase